MKRWIIGTAALVISLGVAADSRASLLTLDMGPYDSQILRDGVIQVGALGLWLGEDFDYNDGIVDWESPYKNWEWTNTTLEIENDGDALISGTMTRLYDGSTWGIELKLMDLELRGDVFAGHSGAYAGMVDDLLADGSGSIEWDRLRMRLHAPYITSVPLIGWRGLTMPSQGHVNPAELTVGANGQLNFEAWYRNPLSLNYHYRVGDSKASARGENPVPEPATALLVGLGLLAAGGRRLRLRRSA